MQIAMLEFGDTLEKSIYEFGLNFLKFLIDLGEAKFGSQSYFFEKPGVFILQWFFVLLPYLIGLLIWSIRYLWRTIKLKI